MKALRLLLLLLLPSFGQAQTYTNTDGIWGFTTNAGNSSLTLTSYTGTNTVVATPASISGLPVIFVGDDIFWGCTNLSNLTISSNIIGIEDYVFEGCTSLTNITIPQSVTGIGNYTFSGCTSLATLTIPNSVTSIGSQDFLNCTSLSAICVETNDPSYTSVNEVLFNKNQTMIVQYPPGKIGNCTIPDNVTNIEAGAFYGCDGLTGITIPNSLPSVAEEDFAWCTGLTNVIMGNSVTNIGDDAFADCGSLASITIGTNVTSIGNAAFLDCHNLTNLTIPDSVTSIGEEAFNSCLGLTNIMIPAGVTNIGQAAFNICISLTAITVATNNPSYSSVDGVLFDKSQTTLIQYPTAKPCGKYTMGNSVTSIGYGAFDYCASLASITIGNSVTNIGDDAFEYCFSLTTVTIGNSLINIGEDAFGYCAGMTGVYFQGNAPANVGSGVFNSFYGYEKATVYYLPGTTGWSSLLGGLPTELWNPQTSGSGIDVQANQFGFNITGSGNLVIMVEACTNLANGSWSPIFTNTLVNGSVYFSDPEWTNYPERFYRLTMP
jgi:hypothetical protein